MIQKDIENWLGTNLSYSD